MRLRSFAFACVAATAAALRPTVWRAATSCVQRTTTPLALQNGWVTGVDEASGQTYYYNEQTGQSQWEPPEAASSQGYGGPVLWRLLPALGVFSEYAVGPGEEQVLGCGDMVAPEQTMRELTGQSQLVSQAQCLVQVAPDGTASVVSLGERPTGLRAHGRAPWYALRKEAAHVLVDGEEIALDDGRTAVFTCQAESAGAGAGYAQQDGRGWTTAVDEASGETYYINEQTGQTQWEPP